MLPACKIDTAPVLHYSTKLRKHAPRSSTIALEKIPRRNVKKKDKKIKEIMKKKRKNEVVSKKIKKWKSRCEKYRL